MRVSSARCRLREIHYVSRNDYLAALQIAVGGFLPAFSSSVSRLGEGGIVLSAVAKALADEWLWRTSLSMGFLLSFPVSRFEIVMRRFQEHESSGHIEVDLSCRIVHSMT